MSEIKRLPNLLLKEFNLISYVQELSESKHKQSRLFTPSYPKIGWLVIMAWSGFKRSTVWGFYYLLI